MSLRSLEMRSLLDNTIIPRMRELLSDIVSIEPYSYKGDVLDKKEFDMNQLVSINDFLEEYANGTEELSDAKIMEIIKLLGNFDISIQPEIFTPASNEQPTETLFTVKVDGVLFTGNISVGFHTIEVIYNKTCDVTKIVYGQKIVGAKGNRVILSNVYVSSTASIEMRAYGENNILLTSAMLTHTTDLADFTLTPTYYKFNQKAVPGTVKTIRYYVTNGNYADGSFTVSIDDVRVTPSTAAFDLGAGNTLSFIATLDTSSPGSFTNITVTVTETVSGRVHTAIITGLTVATPLTGDFYVTPPGASILATKDQASSIDIEVFALHDEGDFTITSISPKVTSITPAAYTIADGASDTSTVVFNTSVIGEFSIDVIVSKTDAPTKAVTVPFTLTVTEKQTAPYWTVLPAAIDLNIGVTVGTPVTRSYTIANELQREVEFTIESMTGVLSVNPDSLTLSDGESGEFEVAMNTSAPYELTTGTIKITTDDNQIKYVTFNNIDVVAVNSDITTSDFYSIATDTNDNIGSENFTSYEVNPIIQVEVAADSGAYPLYINIQSFLSGSFGSSIWNPLAIQTVVSGAATITSGLYTNDSLLVTEDSVIKVILFDLKDKVDLLGVSSTYYDIIAEVTASDGTKTKMTFEGDTVFTTDLTPRIVIESDTDAVLPLPSKLWVWGLGEVETSPIRKSYYGINTSGLIPTDVQILAEAEQTWITSTSITWNPDTDGEAGEYAWVAVPQVQTGHDYTAWYVTSENQDDIGASNFIIKKGTVVVETYTYDVYMYAYPSTLNADLTLS